MVPRRADRLGLDEGDVLVRVDELPLTDEAELMAAASRAYEAAEVAVFVLREGVVHERRLVRGRS